jgi:hypothetical protein
MLKRLLITLAVLTALYMVPSKAAAQSSAWTAPKAGVWKVTGRDDDGTRWTGSFTVTRRQRVGSHFEIHGYFRWRSLDGETAGRESVKGTFYPANGKLSLRGYAVKSERGEIMRTTYASRVSNRGRSITKGRWYGKDVVKGTWRADWQKSK